MLLCYVRDLQVSALPREGALQSQVEPAGGRLLGAAVHRVQAGVASLLHQGGKAGAADGLLKLLDKLEEGPEGGGRRASAQHSTAPAEERGGVPDVSPVGLLHRLLDGPETDVVPLGDLDKVLKTRGVIRVEL